MFSEHLSDCLGCGFYTHAAKEKGTAGARGPDTKHKTHAMLCIIWPSGTWNRILHSWVQWNLVDFREKRSFPPESPAVGTVLPVKDPCAKCWIFIQVRFVVKWASETITLIVFFITLEYFSHISLPINAIEDARNSITCHSHNIVWKPHWDLFSFSWTVYCGQRNCFCASSPSPWVSPLNILRDFQ